jgi:hypothetical protein
MHRREIPVVLYFSCKKGEYFVGTDDSVAHFVARVEWDDSVAHTSPSYYVWRCS